MAPAKGQYPSLSELVSGIFFCYAPQRRKKPQWHQKDRCPDIAACVPKPCRTRLRPPRTMIGITATNRQPSKKDAFAVSID
jgi:hypothetical protein